MVSEDGGGRDREGRRESTSGVGSGLGHSRCFAIPRELDLHSLGKRRPCDVHCRARHGLRRDRELSAGGTAGCVRHDESGHQQEYRDRREPIAKARSFPAAWPRHGSLRRCERRGLEWTNGDWVLYRKARSLGPRRTALHGLARRPVVGNEADGAQRRAWSVFGNPSGFLGGRKSRGFPYTRITAGLALSYRPSERSTVGRATLPAADRPCP